MNQLAVILPLHAPAPWLHQTLSSLKMQTKKSWDLVCTADASSVDLLDEVEMSFPAAHRLIVPSGTPFPAVLNSAVQATSARYIARIDQDDLAFRNRLEWQFEAMERAPQLDVLCTPAIEINPDGVPIGYRSTGRWGLPRELLLRNSIVHPSIMARRKSIETVGLYDPLMTSAEDYDLWLRIALDGKIGVLKFPLTLYRRHAHQMSATWSMEDSVLNQLLKRKLRLGRSLRIPASLVRASHLAWSARHSNLSSLSIGNLD